MENTEVAVEAEVIEPERPEADPQVLRTLAIRLGDQFDSLRSQLKNDWQDEWVEAYRQYAGKYSVEEERRFDSATHKGSRVFMNITRPKTNTGISHLMNVVHPTDGRNYGIKPSPYNKDPLVFKQRADAMEEQVEDRFAECSYQEECRKVINDGAVYGTGVIKGPVLTSRVTKAWLESAPGQFALQIVEDTVPSFHRVRPWNFFPDPSATDMSECEFVYERQYLTRSQLQNLSGIPGVIKSELAEVLKTHPDEDPVDDFKLNIMEEVENLESKGGKQKYLMVHYHGPIKVTDIMASGEYAHGEIDLDLYEVHCEAWIIGPYCLKIAINPLPTAELPYSVFNWVKSDASIFGHGIPYLLNNSQRVVNSAYRMMLDNAGISAGPQIVVDGSAIVPQDGDWTIRPNKVWKKKDTDIQVDHAFKVYHITNNQGDLAQLLKLGQMFADSESSIPLVAQGGEGTHTTQTKGGIAMLINQTNIATKQVVKNYDDFTVANVKRQVAWEMEFNSRAEIKGDFHIDAKGSSELLTKETQAQNVMALNQLAATPQYQGKTNWDNLFQTTVEAMQFDRDKIILSAEQQEEKAKNTPPPQPDFDQQVKMKEVKLKEQELLMKQKQHDDKMLSQKEGRDVKTFQLQLDFKRALLDMANKRNISTEQLANELEKATLAHLSKRTIVADELKANQATNSEFK